MGFIRCTVLHCLHLASATSGACATCLFKLSFRNAQLTFVAAAALVVSPPLPQPQPPRSPLNHLCNRTPPALRRTLKMPPRHSSYPFPHHRPPPTPPKEQTPREELLPAHLCASRTVYACVFPARKPSGRGRGGEGER